jgi:ferritin
MQTSNALTILLNNQITAELFSSNLYLGMAIQFKKNNYLGFAAYMLDKAEEERGHALRFIDFMGKANIVITLEEIESPESMLSQIKTCVDAFMAAYYHEVKITGTIHMLIKQATLDGNYPVLSFLREFVDEQVEEEDEALTVYEKSQGIISDIGAMQAMDCHFSKIYGNLAKIKLEL